MEFDRQFSTEEACREYLVHLRWPEGFLCPRCGHKDAWKIGKLLYECAGCNYQLSVIAGTIFQQTHKPLMMWFKMMWYVTTQKNGASALGLQKILGLGSYRTAWSWMHKLRRAMVRPGRDRLSGRVEVDETYFGAPEDDVYGRALEKKALIVIAAEERGKGIGRVRIRRARDASADSLIPFVVDSVQPGSTIHTDGWDGYTGLEEKGYLRDVTPVGRKKGTAVKLMPRVHSVASHLHRWLLGTLHGGVSHEQLDYYLDEFTFRFNRRTSRYRGKLFYRLAQQSVLIEPHPYRELVGSTNANLKPDNEI
jgi:transposase-like protein